MGSRWRRPRLREIRALAEARRLLARVPEGLPEDTLRGMLEARRHSPAIARATLRTLLRVRLARTEARPGSWWPVITLRRPRVHHG